MAGVTIFRPEPGQLRDLMQRLAEEGLEVLVHVDGPTGHAIDADLLSELQTARGVTVFQAPVNRGIGAGLNALAQAARTAGFRKILLFDQDSAPLPGLAFRLEHAFDFLLDAGARPAVVGPRPVAASGETSKPPRYSKRPRIAAVGNLRPVNYVISSGSLVSLDAIDAVGDFRDDYFIDAIDTEWCFRAWHRGRSVWSDDRLEMPHRVGSGVVRFGPLRFPQQSEARMITYLRNQSHGLRLPHVPLRWKVRFIAYAPLQAAAYVARAPRKRRSASRFLRAISDGLRARLGPIK
ncbi:MAG TPA: rhamnosyltransferase [Aurantimonas sp.]|nr:rhamnosyltransferase [Aurantimonas sp.]